MGNMHTMEYGPPTKRTKFWHMLAMWINPESMPTCHTYERLPVV